MQNEGKSNLEYVTRTDRAKSQLSLDNKIHNKISYLSHGQSGTVFLFTGNIVVKEFLRPDRSKMNDYKTEAEINNILYGNTHLNITQKPYSVRLVMPLIPGVPLAGLVSDYKLSNTSIFSTKPQILLFVRVLFAAFGAVHEKGIVHGDKHLKNILIDNEGELRLCDFGRAKFYTKHNLHLLHGELNCLSEFLMNLIKSCPVLTSLTTEVQKKLLQIALNLREAKIENQLAHSIAQLDTILTEEYNCHDKKLYFLYDLVKELEINTSNRLLAQNLKEYAENNDVENLSAAIKEIKENKHHFHKILNFQVDQLKNTPLLGAANYGCCEAIKVLCEAGADQSVENDRQMDWKKALNEKVLKSIDKHEFKIVINLHRHYPEFIDQNIKDNLSFKLLFLTQNNQREQLDKLIVIFLGFLHQPLGSLATDLVLTKRFSFLDSLFLNIVRIGKPKIIEYFQVLQIEDKSLKKIFNRLKNHLQVLLSEEKCQTYSLSGLFSSHNKQNKFIKILILILLINEGIIRNHFAAVSMFVEHNQGIMGLGVFSNGRLKTYITELYKILFPEPSLDEEGEISHTVLFQ